MRTFEPTYPMPSSSAAVTAMTAHGCRRTRSVSMTVSPSIRCPPRPSWLGGGGGRTQPSDAGTKVIVTMYATITPSPATSPKSRSIALFDTASEPRPIAVVAEVKKHATAMVRTVRWSASAARSGPTRATSSR